MYSVRGAEAMASVSLWLSVALLAFLQVHSFIFHVPTRYSTSRVVTGQRLSQLQSKFHQRLPSLRDAKASPAIVSSPDEGSKQTLDLFSSSVNLLKNCVGPGVFFLNGRISRLATNPWEQFHKISMLTVLMAAWSAYNFYLIGRTCELTKTQSFGAAWAAAVSPSSVWLVQAVTTVAPLIGCVSSTIILSEIFSLILRICGLSLERGPLHTIFVCCALYPLCSLKDLSNLKSLSFLGILCQLAINVILLIRGLDGSYQPGGRFFNSANFYSQRHAMKGFTDWAIFASILSYCFVCHYNAPGYYAALEKKNSNRFLKMSLSAYSAASFVYLITIVLNLWLFGVNAQPFVLRTFSQHDTLANFAMIMFGVSVLTSFPLQFMNARNYFSSSNKMFSMKNTTAILLTCICVVATNCRDVSRVAGFSGALFGTTMMFIFPPVMFMMALLKPKQRELDQLLSTREKMISLIKITTVNRRDPNSNQSKFDWALISNTLLILGGTTFGIFGFSKNCAEMLNK